MHSRGSSRSSGQKRPRLLRASATEPTLFTSSIVKHGALDMSQPTSMSCVSGSPNGAGGSSTYHRRATDILNHVVYLSSCASSPVSSFAGQKSPFYDNSSAHYASSGASASSHRMRSASGEDDAMSSRSRGIRQVHSGTSTSGSRTTSVTAEACGRMQADHDEMFGSSPASTHTSGSLDDLHPHPYSANYYSFPSFDTWDPDSQEKEDDIDG